MEDFLSSLNLPSLTKEQNKSLIAEITEKELNSAISRLKAKKTPGPDGYPPVWYKTFRKELVPCVLKANNTVFKKSTMPPSWKEAVISVIPNEGKDRLKCESYRPISVLNVD